MDKVCLRVWREKCELKFSQVIRVLVPMGHRSCCPSINVQMFWGFLNHLQLCQWTLRFYSVPFIREVMLSTLFWVSPLYPNIYINAYILCTYIYVIYINIYKCVYICMYPNIYKWRGGYDIGSTGKLWPSRETADDQVVYYTVPKMTLHANISAT